MLPGYRTILIIFSNRFTLIEVWSCKKAILDCDKGIFRASFRIPLHFFFVKMQTASRSFDTDSFHLLEKFNFIFQFSTEYITRYRERSMLPVSPRHTTLINLLFKIFRSLVTYRTSL